MPANINSLLTEVFEEYGIKTNDPKKGVTIVCVSDMFFVAYEMPGEAVPVTTLMLFQFVKDQATSAVPIRVRNLVMVLSQSYEVPGKMFIEVPEALSAARAVGATNTVLVCPPLYGSFLDGDPHVTIGGVKMPWTNHAKNYGWTAPRTDRMTEALEEAREDAFAEHEFGTFTLESYLMPENF